MADDAVQAALERVAGNLRITKITATRAIKGSTGESFVGFSGGIDSIEDKTDTMLDEVERQQSIEGGLSLKDAKLAHLILAMHTDLQAIDVAWASGSITAQYRSDFLRATKQRYALLIRELVLGPQTAPSDEGQT